MLGFRGCWGAPKHETQESLVREIDAVARFCFLASPSTSFASVASLRSGAAVTLGAPN